MGPFLTTFVIGMVLGTWLRALPFKMRLWNKAPSMESRAVSIVMLAFGELFVLAGWVHSLGRSGRGGTMTEGQAFGGGMLWACVGALICVGVLRHWPVSI